MLHITVCIDDDDAARWYHIQIMFSDPSSFFQCYTNDKIYCYYYDHSCRAKPLLCKVVLFSNPIGRIIATHRVIKKLWKITRLRMKNKTPRHNGGVVEFRFFFSRMDFKTSFTTEIATTFFDSFILIIYLTVLKYDNDSFRCAQYFFQFIVYKLCIWRFRGDIFMT